MIETHAHSPSEMAQPIPVDTFIQKLWNLPTLTPELKMARQTAAENMLHFLDQLNSVDDIVAVPVGSLIWIIDETSDYDYVVFCKSWKDVIAIKENATFQSLARELRLHLLPVKANPRSLAVSALATQLFATLVTPESMAVGNKDYLREIQQNLFNPDLYDEQSQVVSGNDLTALKKHWNESFKTYLQNYYLHWKHTVLPDEIGSSSEFKRSRRYEIFMKTRSAFTGEEDLEAQTQSVISTLENQIPTFDDLKPYYQSGQREFATSQPS